MGSEKWGQKNGVRKMGSEKNGVRVQILTKLAAFLAFQEKWGQGANLDKISRFPSLPACHEACVLLRGLLRGQSQITDIRFAGVGPRGKWGQGKWGQGANLDKISRFPRLPACHEACVLNFPVPITT